MLSKGHRPGWSKASPKDMRHRLTGNNLDLHLEVPGLNLGIIAYFFFTLIMSIIIVVVYWK
jgi:hypothetical protein